MENQNSVIVEYPLSIRIVGLLALVGVILFFMVPEFIKKPSLDLAFFFLFAGFICWLLWGLFGASIEANSEFIRVKAINGRYKIFWQEVTVIRTDGSFMGFIGNDRRLVISLHNQNQEAGMFQLLQLIDEQARRRNIPIEKLTLGQSMPLTHENTRE